jgi:hypothetical protein
MLERKTARTGRERNVISQHKALYACRADAHCRMADATNKLSHLRSLGGRRDIPENGVSGATAAEIAVG